VSILDLNLKQMKKYISILLFLTLLATSCANSNKKESSEDKPITEKKNPSVSQIIKKAKENSSTTDKLKEIAPITNAEMDAWMPTEIGSLERTSYLVDMMPQMDIFMTKATFKDPSNQQQLVITFMDGAGEKGSKAIGPYLNLENLYKDKADDQGFQKLMTRNAMTIVQKYRKQGDKFDLEFAVKNRYAIKLETKGLTESELWSAFDQFHFQKLKGI